MWAVEKNLKGWKGFGTQTFQISEMILVYQRLSFVLYLYEMYQYELEQCFLHDNQNNSHYLDQFRDVVRVIHEHSHNVDNNILSDKNTSLTRCLAQAITLNWGEYVILAKLAIYIHYSISVLTFLVEKSKRFANTVVSFTLGRTKAFMTHRATSDSSEVSVGSARLSRSW